MSRGFLQVAIPVLYVYDDDAEPSGPPGFDMGLLPVVSRVLKDHAGTEKVTVITGAPTLAPTLPMSYTRLALQYAQLKKASPEAGNLIVAEFVADNFDVEKVLEHLQRIVEERQRALAEQVELVTKRRERIQSIEGEENPTDDLEATEDAGEDEDADEDGGDETPRGV